MTRVKILLLTLLLSLTAAACTATQAEIGPVPFDTADSAQIYAAAIREIHEVARSTHQVFLVTRTEDLAGVDAPAAPSQPIPTDLQEAIAAELAEEKYELIWIAAFEDAPVAPIDLDMEEGWLIAGGEGMVITLGNIHPQKDGSVLLSFWMACADMCGYGTTYVLAESSNNWYITDRIGPELAS